MPLLFSYFLVMDVIFHPSRWCAPAVIQAIISIMTIAMILFYSRLELTQGMTRPLAAFLYLCISVILIYIMLYLCQNNLGWVSWLILLFPLIMALLMR